MALTIAGAEIIVFRRYTDEGVAAPSPDQALLWSF